jgi:hypothetical protein
MAIEVRKVIVVHKDIRVQEVLLVPLLIEVHKRDKVREDSKVLKALRELVETEVHKVTVVHKVIRAHKVQRVLLLIEVHKRDKVLEDFRVLKVLREPMV